MSASMIQYLTGIRFGAGAIRELTEVLNLQHIKRPLLVSDTGILNAGLHEHLPTAMAATFADVPANPTEAAVNAAAEAFRAAECDGIVALGGGSPIDCAKAVSLRVSHAGPLEDYAIIRGGLSRITANKPPVIAIPTTSGTGSEVGRAALITVASGAKLGLISPHMIPSAAICDPELTLGLPPHLTAATGMDAISHCVETFCSPKWNPVADSIALDGLGRAVRSLRAAVNEGRSIHWRSEMMLASLQGGLTFQKGLGLIHSLSHPMGAVPGKRLHHGTLNAIFLPHVLRFNASACCEQMQRMAAVMNVSNPSALPEVFERLIRDLGLPATLRELDVDMSDLDGIPEAALRDHSTPSNPRRLTEEDCRAVLHAAL